MSTPQKIQKKVLIVDDHPMIIVAYRKMLSAAGLSNYNLNIDTANSCDSAIKRINQATIPNTYDIAFLDIKLPPSADGKIVSGEDLAVLLREQSPRTKIVILTMFNESYRIHDIIKSINPDGLLIKNDVNPRNFVEAFLTTMDNPPYYSKTVNKLRELNLPDIVLDDINRKIIYHLSKGIKTKNIGNYVDLTLSAVEKRKSYIKKVFSIDNASDEQLIEAAQKRGYI